MMLHIITAAGGQEAQYTVVLNRIPHTLDTKEQCVHIKLCSKPGATAIETYNILKLLLERK
jgi:hypothetical protein